MYLNGRAIKVSKSPSFVWPMAHSRIQAYHDDMCPTPSTTSFLRQPPFCSVTKAIYQDFSPLENYLHERFPQSNVAQATSQHECRGVPAASKGERNSSGCFFESARLPKSFTRSSCPLTLSSSQHSIRDYIVLLSG